MLVKARPQSTTLKETSLSSSCFYIKSYFIHSTCIDVANYINVANDIHVQKEFQHSLYLLYLFALFTFVSALSSFSFVPSCVCVQSNDHHLS